MRKRTIWILCIIMCFSSVMLMILQVRYIKGIVAMRQQQFEAAVNRALSSVSRDLELAESKRYLEEDMKEMEQRQQALEEEGLFSPNIYMFANGAFRIDIPPFPGNGQSLTSQQNNTGNVQLQPLQMQNQSTQRQPSTSINNVSKERQEVLLKRYLSQKALLDEVIYAMLNRSRNINLRERIDQNQLREDISTELEYNGIELPFHYMVTDVNGRMVCSCGCPDFDPNHHKNSYKQVLFGGDNAYRMGMLHVFFPTLKDYILLPVGFLLPSLSFIAILIVTFLFTLYLVLRQKKLTEVKNDFINNMTHEFKTPLSTISLAAQMLNDETVVKSPTMFKHISGVINDETKRLRFQVEKVLQMSMFDRQKTNLKMREVDMKVLIEGVVKTFTLKVENSNGSLHFVQDNADNTFVMGDEMHLTNVIFNLLDNAIKYKRDDINLQLTVTIHNEGNNLVIVVSDNGIGIKKEDIKNIFDKFYRVHTGNRHDVKGFGLGLAYVKKVVLAHNGTIRAESEFNHGTDFIITLPSCSMD